MPTFSIDALFSIMAWLVVASVFPFLLAIGTTVGTTILIWIVEGAEDFAP